MRYSILSSLLALSLFLSSPTWGAVLGNPGNGLFMNGISALTGWKCTAGIITVRFDGGIVIEVSYGSPREDTRAVCGHANTGFALLINWNLLGDGQHRVKVFDDNVLFASATFTVITPGAEFLRGARATVTVPDFPRLGETTTLRWQEETQSFVMVARTTSPAPDVAGVWQTQFSDYFGKCSFLGFSPPSLPPSLGPALTVSQNGNTLTAESGSVTFSGAVDSTGEFTLANAGPISETIGGCTVQALFGYFGNFLDGTVDLLLVAGGGSGNCAGLCLPCVVSYNGSITKMAAIQGQQATRLMEQNHLSSATPGHSGRSNPSQLTKDRLHGLPNKGGETLLSVVAKRWSRHEQVATNSCRAGQGVGKLETE